MVSIDETDVSKEAAQGPEIMMRPFARVVAPEMHACTCGGLRVVGWVWGQNLLAQNAGKMQSNEPKRVLGERGRIRTCDPCLKRRWKHGNKGLTRIAR